MRFLMPGIIFKADSDYQPLKLLSVFSENTSNNIYFALNTMFFVSLCIILILTYPRKDRPKEDNGGMVLSSGFFWLRMSLNGIIILLPMLEFLMLKIIR